MRTAHSGARYLLAAAGCALMVTACGSTAAPGSSGTSGSPTTGSSTTGTPTPGSPSTGTPAADSLTIQVSHGNGTAITLRTLRCQPAGGTEPDATTACKVLQSVKNPFGPLPKGIMCPMIIAGTKTAKVTGTWDGKRVNITLNDGGCWLARWGKIGQIFN